MHSALRRAEFSIVVVTGLLCGTATVSAAQAQTASTLRQAQDSGQAASTSSGQAYPARPIRVIVPFPPGGSNDIVARLVGAHLTERLGKPVVVDNRGGAGGRIGYETAATSHPDGHTLLVISAAYAFTPALHKLKFDAARAFVPVAMLGTGANALAVFPGAGLNSVKETESAGADAAYMGASGN